MNDKKVDKLVVKHNKLIEFKGRMTVSELKLFSLIIADVRENQEGIIEQYNIDISILKDATNHKAFYNYLKEVAFKLEDRSIEVERLNDKGKKTSFKMRLIYRPEITEDSKQLKLFIDKELIGYILDLKREFTRYQITNILKLNSSYSVRVYELLKQYENIGKREIDIQVLREYLGIELTEYERFYDFEKRVLRQAIQEINEHTDILIDYEKIKTGRRITSILFKIESKKSEQEIFTNDIPELKIKMGLGAENFSNKQIIDIYSLAVEKTQGNIDVYEYVRMNYLHIKDKARNKYSYLIKAIENDYALASNQIKLDYITE